MRTEAGNRRVIHVFHTVERMRARNQRLQNALASDACKSHDGIHSGQGVRRQLRIGGCGPGGAFHGSKRAVDPKTNGCGFGFSGSELRILRTTSGNEFPQNGGRPVKSA